MTHYSPFLKPLTLFGVLFSLLIPGRLSGQVFEVQEMGKWGFMDRKGQLVVPTKYDFIYSDILSRPDRGLFVVQTGEKMGVYQTDRGEIIPTAYEQIQIGEYGDVEVWQDGKVGLLNLQGQQVLPPQYHELVQLDSFLYKIRTDSSWGVWHKQAGHLIPASLADVSLSHWGHLLGQSHAGSYGVWDTQGDLLFDSFPAPLYPLSPYMFGFQENRQNNRNGLVGLDGTILFPPQLGAIQPYKAYFLGHQDSLFGLFDDKGRQLLDLQYEKIITEGEDLFWIKQSGLWGIADTSGTIRIEPLFYRQGRFKGPVGIVTQAGRYGLINRAGEFLTDLDCERVRIYGRAAYILRNGERTQLTFNEQGQLIPRKKSLIIRTATDSDSLDTDTSLSVAPSNPNWNIPAEPYGWFYDTTYNKWGLLDSLLDTLIIPTFKEVYVIPRFNMSMVILRPEFSAEFGNSSRKCGLINHQTGEYLLNPVLNMIYIQDFARYPAARAQFSTRGFKLVSYRGQVYGPDFVRYMGPFEKGIARICQKGNIYAPFVSEAGLEPQFDPQGLAGSWSYMNLRGKVSETPTYSYAENYIGKLALVKQQDKWGAINRRFQAVIPTEYDSLFYPKSLKEEGPSRGSSDTGLLCAVVEQQKYFFLDEHGSLIFSRTYEAVGEYSEGLARFKLDGKWGYVDQKGNEVIEAQFGKAGDFHDGVANVQYKRKWGYINLQGEWVVSPAFQQAGKMIDGVARVQEGRRFGYIQSDGKWLVKTNYVEASDFLHGIAIVRKPEKKFGVIDRRGKWLLPQKFEQISWIGDNLKVINDKDLTGFYGIDGQSIARPQYEYVGNFHEGLARFKKAGKYGYLDSSLQVVIPARYASAGNFHFGLAVIGKPRGYGNDNWWGAINHQGREVIAMNNLAIDIRGYGNVWADRVDSVRAGWRRLDLSTYFSQQPLTLAKINANHVLFEKINRKYGYVNIHQPKNGMVIAETDRLLGILDHQGKWLIHPVYESIQYRDGLYKIVNNGDIGYLDENGSWIWELRNKK
ncbi:MAG: WG repeat-containing protein [Bacteroidota bacterium]